MTFRALTVCLVTHLQRNYSSVHDVCLLASVIPFEVLMDSTYLFLIQCLTFLERTGCGYNPLAPAL